MSVGAVVSAVVVPLLAGWAAGSIWAFRRYTQRWNAERLRDLEHDVDYLYVTRGLRPPSVDRARRTLGVDETPLEDR